MTPDIEAIAEQVFSAVRHELPHISLATIYKALDALVDAGLARRLLGWVPLIPWEQTLSDVLQEWRERAVALAKGEQAGQAGSNAGESH